MLQLPSSRTLVDRLSTTRPIRLPVTKLHLLLDNIDNQTVTRLFLLLDNMSDN